jgi:methoxymalonate biosynthesis acyl carrier protein
LDSLRLREGYPPDSFRERELTVPRISASESQIAMNVSTDLDSIKLELRNYIREQYRIASDDPDFSDDVHLYDYGYIDSFGAVHLIAHLESRFAIKFTPSDLSSVPLRTVHEFASFIDQRRNGVK